MRARKGEGKTDMKGRLDTRSGGHDVFVPGDKGKELIRLAWRSDKDLRPLPARIVIATKDVETTPQIWPANTFVNITAKIGWANDGAEAEYEVDVCRGIVVTAGPCQSLAVEVSYEKAPFKLLDGPSMRISASAVYGIVASSLDGQKSFWWENIAANDYTPIERIPAFGQSCVVMTDKAQPRPGITLRMFGDNAPVIPWSAKQPLAEFDMGQAEEARVVRGAEFFQLFNRGPRAVYLTASWNLNS